MDKNSRLKLAELKAEFSQQVEEHRGALRQPQGGSVERAFAMIQNFERLSSALYQVRRDANPVDPLREQTEDYMAQVSGVVLAHVKQDRSKNRYQVWLNQYRGLWARHIGLFMLTTGLFLGSCLIGWIISTQYTDYASVLIPQHLMESIVQKNAWFESLNDNPLLGGISIAWNNIRVCINVFLLSAILGLGGLYILCFNGIFFGAVMGFCYLHDFNKPLTEFVLSHGPLELTIIVASAFAGLIFGRVFFMRPYRKFGERMRTAGREAGIVVTGIVPWLILAAAIEGFISPNPGVPFELRIAVGLIAAAVFWVWTLQPAKTETLKV